MAAALEVRGVTKSIGRRKILDRVSFTVEEGEIFGFLGPNGAGKTTTIKIILGMLSADAGEIRIGGVDLRAHYEQAMRKIGGIVETPELYGYLTGYQNLKLYADLRGVPQTRIRQVVSLVRMTDRINEKVKNYSLGMKQRIGVALSILHSPQVLVLDEPTNGLDPAGIKELRDNLKYLAHTAGMSVLVSSHLLSEMQLMCDRVAIIDKGTVIGVKRLSELEDTGSTGQAELFCLEVADAAAAARCAIAVLGEQAVLSEGDGKVEVRVPRSEINALLSAVIAAGVPIYSFAPSGRSLEESFLEITGGGGDIA